MNTPHAIFRYPRSRTIMVCYLIPAVTLGDFGFGICLLLSGKSVLGALFILAFPWLALLSGFGFLMCCPIRINQAGIAACCFGRTLKIIRWRNVAKVGKVRRWSVVARAYQDDFYVSERDRSLAHQPVVNLLGPIAFTEEVEGLRDLLDHVTAYAQRHHIPMTVQDQEAARKRAAQEGAGFLARALAAADEVRVTKL